MVAETFANLTLNVSNSDFRRTITGDKSWDKHSWSSLIDVSGHQEEKFEEVCTVDDV